jgi:hypothetical protein
MCTPFLHLAATEEKLTLSLSDRLLLFPVQVALGDCVVLENETEELPMIVRVVELFEDIEVGANLLLVAAQMQKLEDHSYLRSKLIRNVPLVVWSLPPRENIVWVSP